MKVAIYCRLSEEDKNKQMETDDSSSIKNQKEMLTQYAIERCWEIFDIYSDDDYAGADRKRPEFNRLLVDAKAHKFDIVLCKTQSRFTRELELVEKYINGLFPSWGIRFVSIVDNADTDNKGNKKSRQINGLINEWYLEDMSENIKSVLTARRKIGLHIGSFALYGYKKDPDKKGHIIIDEEAAAIVREVFDLFSKGYGKTEIARILNDRGVPNPTEYKRQQGLRYKQPKNKNSTLWKYFSISNMLTNEIYIGNMVQGKYASVSYKTKQNKPRPKDQWYIVEKTHEPIIDQKIWDKVQELIKQRIKPFSSGTIGIFAKKVRCSGCDYVMKSTKSRERYYLQCQNRYFSKDSCEGAFISVDKLEQKVLQELRFLSNQYLNKDDLERNIEFSQNLKFKESSIILEIKNYQKKQDLYSKAIKDLYIDKVNKIITESDFIELMKKLNIDREIITQILVNRKKSLEKIRNRISAGDNRKEIIDKYINIGYLTREMVDILIDHISVDKRNSGSKEVPIKIYWNF